MPAVQAWSVRVKLGAMFSNSAETTSIRLNGIDPDAEDRATPGLRARLVDGGRDGPLVAPGQVLIPELIARGMKVKVGDTVVLVATNQDGSVNGKNFTVRGVLEPVTGPGGRDGYLHIDDARELLRMERAEAMEIAVRLHDPARIARVEQALIAQLGELKTKAGTPAIEVHTWEALSPFANIERMIDIMTLFIKIMLVAIVLVSVMNVMLMAVYERIREIGTIAAIGTRPRRILGLFVSEGLLLGVIGAAVGTAISLALIAVLNVWKLNFPFGRQVVTLAPTVPPLEVATIVALVLAIAVAASLQPAWKASRMDPITALRHL